MDSKLKLTQYSRASGCGCKIAPGDLQKILSAKQEYCSVFSALLRGYETSDDAAVWDWGDGSLLILTTDFFMPMLDDAEHFGQVAAANALSDVYAMGARPFLALGILGWPLEKLGAELAARVLEGARKMCQKAGIPLAGGHSVDAVEPFFGLCVAGRCPKENLKTNGGAQPGDVLYLTKPLGTGILLSAYKKGMLNDKETYPELLAALTRLNSAGEWMGTLRGVHALTDVTGFGLLGHLIEMCRASSVSAELTWSDVPRYPLLDDLAARFVYPDITFKTWNSFSNQVQLSHNPNDSESAKKILVLCDPQTNGGLLAAVAPDEQTIFEDTCRAKGVSFYRIGTFIPQIPSVWVRVRD